MSSGYMRIDIFLKGQLRHPTWRCQLQIVEWVGGNNMKWGRLPLST